jgi:membrane-bound metal-dependent hydrolase YbcI (DUF457 family)
MQGKNHVALALAIPLAGAMLAGVDLPSTVAGWGGLIIGSLAPDIDGEGSVCYLGNFLPHHITPKPVIAILNGLGKTISGVVRSIFGHRKALHWPAWGVGLMVLGINFDLDWLIWFGLGYGLHIAGDSLTKSGVPLFGPVLSVDISFTPMVTGKWVESAFGYLLWLFVAWRLAVQILPRAEWLWQLIHRFGGSLL